MRLFISNRCPSCLELKLFVFFTFQKKINIVGWLFVKMYGPSVKIHVNLIGVLE